MSSIANTLAERGRPSSAASSPTISPAVCTASTASYPVGDTDEIFTLPRRITTT
jgi:hypothetical protein